MLVSSSVNPSFKSATSFVVIAHEESRVIVPTDSLPKFSDVFEFVRREWGVKHANWTLETNELDICAGEWVRIHEDAWPGLKDVIGTVHVNRAGSNLEPRAQIFEGLPQSNTNQHESKPLSTRFVSVKKEDTRQTTESADEGEVEEQVTADEGEIVAAAAITNENEHANKEKDVVNTTAGPKSTARNDKLNLFGDPEERLLALKKPPSNNEGLRTQTFKPSSKRLPTKELAASSKSRPTTAGTSTPSRSVSPIKEVTKGTASAPSPAPTSEDPERVLILVEIVGQHEPRPFRIRRDYTVHSVLKGVSKVFDFDYTRATLNKVNRDPDASYSEDDEELETTTLERTDTMRTLGITDRQRFVVEVMEEDGESD